MAKRNPAATDAACSVCHRPYEYPRRCLVFFVDKGACHLRAVCSGVCAVLFASRLRAAGYALAKVHRQRVIPEPVKPRRRAKGPPGAAVDTLTQPETRHGTAEQRHRKKSD